ncbi:hypothetical protein BKA62DRAFT_785370 [Auriculariales sp. MPI-PUGE-AT-0066]|nr:hypothetical protein BKA62DRAFT_785370 [Auriculariales sp. MPI-PUGE-AT-0066]
MSTELQHSVAGHHLPPELWLTVFFLTKNWDDSDWDVDAPSFTWPPNSVATPEQCPLLLGRVCREWRNLSISCGSLWTLVEYNITENSISRGGLEGLEQFLSRSGSLPICLIIETHLSDPERINPFMELYYRHFHRVKFLRLSLGGGILEQGVSVIPFPRNQLPVCRIIDTSFRFEDYSRWLAPVFAGDLPALRALRMQEFVHHFESQDSRMPVAQHLQNLIFLDAVANNFDIRPVDVLQRCTNVRHFTMYFRLFGAQWGEGMDISDVAPFVVPNLQSLSLRAAFHGLWRDVLAPATCPALEELTMIGRVWQLSPVLPFLERSQCPLRKLNLSGSNVPTADLLQVLHLVTGTLERLQLSRLYGSQKADDRDGFNDNILDLMDPQLHGTNVLLPRLDYLELEAINPSTAADGRFVEVVRARTTTSNTVPFKHITLVSYDVDSFASPGFHMLDFSGIVQLAMEDKQLSLVINPNLWTARSRLADLTSDEHRLCGARMFYRLNQRPERLDRQ